MEVGEGTPSFTHSQPGLTELVLQLRWDHQFQFAGYYAAQWMGYYEEEGLNVDIRSAFTEQNPDILDAALEVEEGRADFGVGAANLMMAQDDGLDLILVASIFQRSAVEYVTLLEDRGNTVFDLSQLHIARRPGDLLDLELQALLASEGIAPYATRTTDITRDFTLEDLINKTFDVVPDFLGQIPYAAEKAGIPVKVIRPGSHGIDFYGDTLFTSGKLARSNPELVERFRRASIKGWFYALEHPMEISELIVTRLAAPDAAPERQAALLDFNLYQAGKVLELTHYPIVEVGNINPFRWIKMAEAMKSLGMIEEVPDLDAMIFDYDQVKMTQLENTRKNLAYAFLILTALITFFFVVYLKRRNTLLLKEIDDRQLAERQLVLSNARYETIFRSSVLGITVTDSEGNIRHVNDAWCSMTGYTADELCRMNIDQLIAADSRGLDAGLHRDLMDGRISSYSMEKKYLRKPDPIILTRKTISTAAWSSPASGIPARTPCLI
jgi:ABC-type nitrate/sulfonate/bicarbonate transport system substrate-binding protein